MKLISFDKNRTKYVMYPHVIKTIEGIAYQLKTYPQCPTKKPKLNTYQYKDLMDALLWEAQKRGMYVRHH